MVSVGASSDSAPKKVPEKPQMNRHKHKDTEGSNCRRNNETPSQGSKRRHENIVADEDLSDKKANKCKELTMQDMYDNTNEFEDEEDDSDWEPCSIVADDDMNDKKANNRSELTMHDMYNNTNELEDEEDDSDWDPFSKSPRLLTWFCCNCTMPNLDNAHHCDTCGEHKESGILKHGFLASPFLHSDTNQEELVVKENHKDLRPHFSSEATAIGFDERMLLHSEVELKPHPHPERPDRLRAIAAGLATAGIYPGKCSPISAREITKEELLKVHSLEHIEAVDLTSHLFSSYFTSDTYANTHSACAARLAAGLCADLASAIYSEKVKNGFALVRPPGHHAGVRDSMGFCLHNNAAIAALAAQVAGAKKVLILDWDVHHGNGTQEIFELSKSVLYISLHRHERGKFYPGTGAANEVGRLGGEGFCVNIPWNRGGVGDKDYIFAFEHVVMPIANEFAPDFVIVSAGFAPGCGGNLASCQALEDAGVELVDPLCLEVHASSVISLLQSDIKMHFGKYGNVERVDLKSGFAFVYREDEQDADDVVRRLDLRDFGAKGRRLCVEWTNHYRGGDEQARKHLLSSEMRSLVGDDEDAPEDADVGTNLFLEGENDAVQDCMSILRRNCPNAQTESELLLMDVFRKEIVLPFLLRSFAPD